MQIELDQLTNRTAEAEAFLKQLSNRNRLMILCVLMDQELSVSELNERVPLSQSALSQHLSKLRESKLVSTRRDAQTIYYQLCDERVNKVLTSLYEIFCQD